MQGYNALNKGEYQKAVKSFQKACDGGDSRGCFGLGTIYEFGKGAKQDKRKAKEYYGRACDLKNEKGCQNYARLNEAGY